jgi:poly(A)-specific ribonuclease
VLNPSSIHFLQQHNMNLDVWTREGIPFCTGDVATNLLDKYYEKQLKLSETTKTKTPSSSTPRSSRRVELTRAEDKDFHARAMASLREWLDAAIVPREEDTEGASLLLPPCNSFLRRALYESIPNEYPNLLLETFQESQIRVWRYVLFSIF